jgi:hypothetical protein
MTNSERIRAFISILVLGVIGSPAWALSDADADATAAAISRHLDRAYPLPDLAKAYSAMLARNIKSGRYHGLAECALADTLTGDLRAVHQDLHLHIRCTRRSDQGNTHPPADDRRAIDTVELDPSLPIAYIRSSGGWDLSDRTFALVNSALTMAAGVDYVILDIRDHPGGRGEIGTLIASYFLPLSEPVPLVRTLMRGDNPSPSETSYPFIPGKRLDHAKLFILVNERTGSAAEGLAFALQQRKRAVIVGQKTAGAGIAGHYEALGHGLSLYLPVKLILAPDGGPGWEGVGVKPDIVTAAGQERETVMGMIRAEQPDLTSGDPLHPDRVTPDPDLTQAPALLDPIESCKTRTYDKSAKRVTFTNRCDKPLSLQFLASNRPTLQWRWQLEPGDMISFAYDPDAEGAWWIAAACPQAYVSATPLREERRADFIKTRYQCIRKTIVE